MDLPDYATLTSLKRVASKYVKVLQKLKKTPKGLHLVDDDSRSTGDGEDDGNDDAGFDVQLAEVTDCEAFDRGDQAEIYFS